MSGGVATWIVGTLVVIDAWIDMQSLVSLYFHSVFLVLVIHIGA